MTATLNAWSTEAAWQALDDWLAAGWLRPLDHAFAAFVAEHDAAASPERLLAAALLAHMEGQGHTCLPLVDALARREPFADQRVRFRADGRAARFYTVVARDTLDQDFAAKRQRFLAEQGYAYRIIDAEDLDQASEEHVD